MDFRLIGSGRSLPCFLRVAMGVMALLLLPVPGTAETLVAYEIVDGREIPSSLTGKPGDPARGRELYLDDKLARCAGCHGVPDGKAAEDAAAGADAAPDAAAGGAPANGAPSLTDVGARLSTGAIRLSLVAPEILRPATRMPSYYGIGQRADPADPRFGEPLMTAAEIEDLVAYLAEQRAGR